MKDDSRRVHKDLEVGVLQSRITCLAQNPGNKSSGTQKHKRQFSTNTNVHLFISCSARYRNSCKATECRTMCPKYAQHTQKNFSVDENTHKHSNKITIVFNNTTQKIHGFQY